VKVTRGCDIAEGHRDEEHGSEDLERLHRLKRLHAAARLLLTDHAINNS
jgi:hypothetical protein